MRSVPGMFKQEQRTARGIKKSRQEIRPDGFLLFKTRQFRFPEQLRTSARGSTLMILVPGLSPSRGYFFLLFGFFTSFFAPCRDCAMCHHLFRSFVSITPGFFGLNVTCPCLNLRCSLSLLQREVGPEPGPLRASWCSFPVCAAFFPHSSFVLLFLSVAFEN